MEVLWAKSPVKAAAKLVEQFTFDNDTIILIISALIN
ncbi:uncharacterized protein METZ01_LOCUS437078 [marine metagenome]|uniref:Uncharacterized protein n=1 Tax=marine metagenome TaxID=408172 RepID=A0A382YLZ0_9ZZZZ